MCSLPIEYMNIANVYRAVPALQRPTSEDIEGTSNGIWQRLPKFTTSLITYACHPVFLPSFALSLLYLTVLSFNGQMITYLLAIGLSSASIGALRGVSAIFELSATWIAPKIMSKIGTVRSGIWFINYQILWVGVASICLWAPTWLGSANASITIGVTLLIVAVILSRVGLWGFDLCVQIIVQEEVEPASRGAFSSQEFATQNMFEMLSFASTIIFARPEEFRIPTTVSACAVAMAGVLYAFFVRARRGHLLHLSTCIERKGSLGPEAVSGNELQTFVRSIG